MGKLLTDTFFETGDASEEQWTIFYLKLNCRQKSQNTPLMPNAGGLQKQKNAAS